MSIPLIISFPPSQLGTNMLVSHHFGPDVNEIYYSDSFTPVLNYWSILTKIHLTLQYNSTKYYLKTSRRYQTLTGSTDCTGENGRSILPRMMYY